MERLPTLGSVVMIGHPCPRCLHGGPNSFKTCEFMILLTFFRILSKTFQNSPFCKGKNTRFWTCSKLGISTSGQLWVDFECFHTLLSGRSGPLRITWPRRPLRIINHLDGFGSPRQPLRIASPALSDSLAGPFG